MCALATASARRASAFMRARYRARRMHSRRCLVFQFHPCCNNVRRTGGNEPARLGARFNLRPSLTSATRFCSASLRRLRFTRLASTRLDTVRFDSIRFYSISTGAGTRTLRKSDARARRGRLHSRASSPFIFQLYTRSLADRTILRLLSHPP